MSIDRAFRPGLPRVLALAAALAGTVACAAYFESGLVLSHYDAKAHLVVARRVIDSLTPGWKQIGAVWLPLPQLLQILPTQVDLLYQTGLFGSLLSLACFTTTVWALSQWLVMMTGSTAAALTTALLLITNPNLLYIHATPMTEPLLLALASLCLLWTSAWLARPADPVPVRLRAALFAAAWTRYEAWAVIAALWLAAAYGLWGSATGQARRRLVELAAAPAAAAALFLVNSKASTGRWFVSDGFYVPDPRYDGNPVESLVAVWWGTGQIGGFVAEAAAIVSAILLVRARGRLLPALAPLAAGLLPLYALMQGHPYRVRYMVTTAVASALLCGVAVARVSRRQAVFAAALVLVTLIELPPWSQQAPLLVEAQWDVPVSRERAAVRACLARDYRGEKILASMGSLAHLMQELSGDGLRIADFIHEGNGALWALALESGPARLAGWMAVEEDSEGGDLLARRIERDAAFAAGMERICEGGGVALYRRSTGSEFPR